MSVKRPTQKDVAQKAGVSRATVSLIINDQAGGNVRISEETRLRVMAAIDELGYRPNQVARSLRNQRTNLCALLIPDITNPYYPLLIRGAQAVADQHNIQLLIYDSDDSAERERTFVDTMLRRRVDGVILVSFHLYAEDVRKLIEDGIEVVSLGDTLLSEGLRISSTTQDYESAIQSLIDHLIEKGHRRIAHIAGPLETPPGLQRLTGYRRALENAGLPYNPDLVKIGQFRPEGVDALVKSLLCEKPESERPTAIFAANDVMAIEAIQVIQSLGLRVPQDVAVCGFDDIPQSAWILPKLTTISQNPYEQGQQVAELLLSRLKENSDTKIKHIRLPYTVVLRDST